MNFVTNMLEFFLTKEVWGQKQFLNMSFQSVLSLSFQYLTSVPSFSLSLQTISTDYNFSYLVYLFSFSL